MLRRVLSSRWLRALVGLGLLAFIVSRADMAEVARLFSHGDAGVLGSALALLLLANPVLQALRLHVLVARYTRRLATTLRIFFVSAFFNTLLPSNLGGDAIRLVELRRHHADNWGGPFALLLLHRASGMAVLLLAAFGCVLHGQQRLRGLLEAAHVAAQLPGSLLSWAAAGCLLIALGWLRLAPELRARIGQRARRFAADCGQALSAIGVGAALQLLLLTVTFHGLRAVAFAQLVRYAGESIALPDVVLVLAVTAISGVVPITIGGLGLVEGAIALMMSLFGVSASAALVVALANRCVLLVGAALGGLVYLAGRAPAAASTTASVVEDGAPKIAAEDGR